MSLLYNRKAYVAFGPLSKLSLFEGVLITQTNSPLNITGGWDDYSIAQLGWPYNDNTLSANQESANLQMMRGFKDLRIKFIIKKNLEDNANKAEIEIYNCSEDSYRILQQVGETYAVQLSAGYGDFKDSLFLGDIEKSSYYREGADWILKLEAKDGQELMQDAIISKSYTEGKSIKHILLDMINTSTFTPRNAYNEVKKWIMENVSLDNIVQQGVSISGKLIDEVNKILSKIGASVSVQDEKVQILLDNGYLPDWTLLISPSTGLIGSPVNRGEGEGIEFRCLLIPIMKPGTLVKVESRIASGYYRIDTIVIKGDTHGKDWEMKCEASEPVNIAEPPLAIKYYENLEIEEYVYQSWKEFV